MTIENENGKVELEVGAEFKSNNGREYKVNSIITDDEGKKIYLYDDLTAEEERKKKKKIAIAELGAIGACFVVIPAITFLIETVKKNKETKARLKAEEEERKRRSAR